MCGIVGYAGWQNAKSVLLEGLKKLEYRGYDSAGMALMLSGDLKIFKGAGEICDLEDKINLDSKECSFGIGHTRWATHGRPSDENAHPHCSCCNKIAIVHNGIIENYQHLRGWLEESGHRFLSETDTEVLVHLVEHYYTGNLMESMRRALALVEGSYALLAVSSWEEGHLVCARKDSPLVIGLGEQENFIASDIPALLSHTRRVYILDDGEMAAVTSSGVKIYNMRGESVDKDIFEIGWDAVEAERGGYPHFMLKEIMEQPQAVRETLRGRLDADTGRVKLSELKFTPAEIQSIEKIHIVACGTAYHAGLVGKYILEKKLQLPVEVDLASEFRYREPLLAPRDLVVAISQSGETADTLAALRLARDKGVRVLAITNVVGSTLSREANDVLFTWAGPEIAVASTKAYLTQLVTLYLLALDFAVARERITSEESAELGRNLSFLPDKIEELLSTNSLNKMQTYAQKLARSENAFFIGRNLDFAVAMEGSLKLKEISYIHAEAHAAGELKHGTLALITEGVPVIALATQQHVLEKTISNVQEVKARDADILILTMTGNDHVEKHAHEVIYLPAINDFFTPILTAVPLQLISYYAAEIRGCSIDKPRNLAKSVTVE